MFRILFITLILLLPCAAFSQPDSTVAATEFIDALYRESALRLEKSGLPEATRLISSLNEKRGSSKAALASLKITENPGPRRARAVQKEAEAFSSEVISSISLLTVATPKEQRQKQELIGSLLIIKTAGLDEISKTAALETPKEKKAEPVPSIDSPGYATVQPEGPPGIWFR